MNAQELRFECLKLAQGDINKAEEYYNFSLYGPDSPNEQPLKASITTKGLLTSSIVDKTIERAGMSAVDWNSLDQQEREDMIADTLASLGVKKERTDYGRKIDKSEEE